MGFAAVITNILWVLLLHLQGSGIGDLSRSCHSVVLWTSEVARQLCSLSLAGMSLESIDCSIEARQDLVTPMTVHSNLPNCLSSFPQVSVKQR